MTLRAPDLDDLVLTHIDEALPRQTWFELIRSTPDGLEIQTAAAFKRSSDADSAKAVTHEHWRSAWIGAATSRSPLPAAVTLEGLYAGLLRSLWPHAGRGGESLRSQAERLSEIAAKTKTVRRLEVAMRRESGFARQVDKNRELRAARDQLKALSAAER